MSPVGEPRLVFDPSLVDSNELEKLAREASMQNSNTSGTSELAMSKYLTGSYSMCNMDTTQRRVTTIAPRVMDFLEARTLEARDLYHKVQMLGWRAASASLLMICLGSLKPMFPHHPLVHVPMVLGCWGASASVAIVSTCDPEETDVDKLLARRPCLRKIFALSAGVIEASRVLVFGQWVSLVCVVMSGFMLVRGRVMKTFSLQLPFALLARLFTRHHWEMLQDGVLPPATTEIVGFATLLWLWCRTYMCRTGHGDATKFTAAFYTSVHTFCFFKAVSFIVRSTEQYMWLEHTPQVIGTCWEFWLAGVGFGISPLVLAIFGRDRWFSLVARYFNADQKRLLKDAAFIACLLESIPVQCGDEWWQWRDVKEERFPHHDVRHHFEKGKIVDVTDDTFTVRFVSPENHVASLREFPMAQRNSRIDVLMDEGASALRRIHWKDFTLDLLQHNSGGDVARNANPFLHVSEPLADGESIDFFISHSWQDDYLAKYAALEEVAADFKRRNGRDPTFWFDRVCIDQSRIGDGLRLLPLTVASCNNILMCCGASYPTRLWCVWELFTCMAFMNLDQAMARIVPVMLSAGDGDETFNGLSTFQAKDANSFDPNDANRLRTVIKAVGEEHFNDRIQQLGKSFQKKGKYGIVVRSQTSSRTGTTVASFPLQEAEDHTEASGTISITVGCTTPKSAGRPIIRV